MRTLHVALPLALALALPLRAPLASAGPLEARAAWEHAQALRTRPWRERALALRRVRAATVPSDSLYARALAAEARLLRDAARVHAAAALEEQAARLGPERDPDRTARLLAQARGLLDEQDGAAARAPLSEAADVARGALPWRADEALEALAELAAATNDPEPLRALVARAEREQARPSTRIALWGAWGLARLERGEPRSAQAALAQAERAFRGAARAEPREAARAAKVWLDLPLRQRLASLPAARGR